MLFYPQLLKLGLILTFCGFLAQFSGAAEEKIKHATATFCSNQPFALEVIKSRQKKDSRFQTFVQVNFMQGFELPEGAAGGQYGITKGWR